MPLNAAIHKNILLQILKDIYSDTTIAPFLGFKGGTAAYLLYGLDRFSVDLDFDLLDAEQEELVFTKVGEIAKQYGTIKDSYRKRFNLLFVISYGEKDHNIKIEINRRPHGSRYEVKTYLGISLKVIVREDMFAHKLMAMHERIGKTSRDIFDVHFFLKNNWPINKTIIEKRSGVTFEAFLKKCISQLDRMSDRNILNGVGELLTESQKDRAKIRLRTDTIFLLKVLLDNE